MLKTLDFIALLSYCFLIYWLSNQSSLPAPHWVENQDKAHHFIAFGVMALCAWRYFRHTVLQPRWLALITIGFCSLYGATDEWHQSFIPGRDSDVLDWVADTIGAVLMTTALYSTRYRKRQSLSAV